MNETELKIKITVDDTELEKALAKAKELQNTTKDSYIRPNEIDMIREYKFIMYNALAKLRELWVVSPEKYLEYAPTVCDMLERYLNSPLN